MISLSDTELAIVTEAARPLKPKDRELFLFDVINALEKYVEIGPGIVARVCREQQRKHFDPPQLQARAVEGYCSSTKTMRVSISPKSRRDGGVLLGKLGNKPLLRQAGGQSDYGDLFNRRLAHTATP